MNILKVKIEIEGPRASGKSHTFMLMVEALRANGFQTVGMRQGQLNWSNGPAAETFEFELRRVRL